MHRGASLSLAFIAERRGQAGQLGAGRSALERRQTSHVEALLLRLASGDAVVGGDGTCVDDKGRPALMRLRGLPLHVHVLSLLSFASFLLQESNPCCSLREERRWGRLAYNSAKKF